MNDSILSRQRYFQTIATSENWKKNISSDKRRDAFMRENEWIVIRIKTKDLGGYKGSFYKRLTREVVDVRREQYQSGVFLPVDMTNYNDIDYE